MNSRDTKLSSGETKGALAGNPFVHIRSALYAGFSTADVVSAFQLVNDAGDIAERAGHHPDISLGCGSAEFTLTSHDVGGVTSRDLDMAERIASAAREVGAQPVGRTPASYEIGIDCTNANA